MNDVVSFLYAPARRTPVLVAAAVLVAGIATVDWATQPNFALSFLYLFPIMLAGGYLAHWPIVGLSFFCAILGEIFSFASSPVGSLPPAEAATRMAMMTVAFAGTGLFVSELVQKRQLALQHVQELSEHIHHREDAEQQLEALIESSPAAIVTVEGAEQGLGTVLLANEAAQHLLAPEGAPLRGQSIQHYLPSLYAVAQGHRLQTFRTHMQCRGQRGSGDVFLAVVWFSTYATLSGPKVAAIIVDLSEDLRDREDLSLNHLLKNSRILIAALSHEIRNLCAALSALVGNLVRPNAPVTTEEVGALQALIGGLEKIASLELQASPDEQLMAVDVDAVLDELRVLIGPSCEDSGIQVQWDLGRELPLVSADQYGLLQVFLNITRNAQRAMQQSPQKALTVRALAEEAGVVIRFSDTGAGIRSADALFRPFQPGADGTGLGLYVSRAILRSFHGELRYEPQALGCCFAVVLRPVKD